MKKNKRINNRLMGRMSAILVVLLGLSKEVIFNPRFQLYEMNHGKEKKKKGKCRLFQVEKSK